MPASEFGQMCEAFRATKAFDVHDPAWQPLPGSPFDAEYVRKACTVPPAMPKIYRDFPKHLSSCLPKLSVALAGMRAAQIAKGLSAKDADTLSKLYADRLVGAVTDWANPVLVPYLQRFQAIVADLVEKFSENLYAKDRSITLTDNRLPLVTFAADPAFGPTALNCEVSDKLCGEPVSVVSLPGAYRRFPLLWGVLSHETGGHVITHLIPKLSDEIVESIGSMPNLSTGWGGIWGAWAEEAAADVYGLLNMGPAFAVSLAAWLTASKKNNLPIGNELAMAMGKAADTHPVDVLRIYLAIGVTEALDTLTYRRRTAWVKRLEDIATEAVNGRDLYVSVFGGPSISKHDLTPIATDARAVGHFIATHSYAALGNRRIVDVKQWTDFDDDMADRVAVAAVTTGAELVPNANDAHYLAGATMALFRDATKFATINAFLVDAFGDSYTNDPQLAGVPLAPWPP